MASREEVIKLTIESAEAAKSVKDVRQSLKAIRDQMLGVAEDSKEFHQLAAAAAELKDRVQDANEAMAAMHPDGFQAVVGFAQKASGAVAGLQGAMALFGGESEEVQKTMMKLQAAMALTQGLESLKDMSKAWRALNAVIAANPVLAIVAGVTALGLAIKEVVAYFNPLNQEAKRLQKISEETTKQVELRSSYLDNEIKIAQARGDSEQQVYELQQKQVQEKIKGAKAALASAEATLKQQEAEKGLIEYLGEAYIWYLKLTGQTELAATMEKGLVARRKENLKEYVDAVDQARLQLDNLLTEQEVIEINHTNFLKEQYKERAAAQAEMQDRSLELQAKQTKFQQEYQVKGVMALKESTQAFAIEGEERAKTLAEKLLDIQAKIYNAAANMQQRFGGQLADSTSQLFGELANASKKNAKAQKAFSVAQAVINTYQAATKALAFYAPPASYIAAAASLVAGFAQVRNIMQTNVDSPSASGGGTGGGMGLAQINDQPNINSAAQPSTLLDEQGNVINQQNNQPTAYVAVTEINEVNNNVQVVENLARF